MLTINDCAKLSANAYNPKSWPYTPQMKIFKAGMPDLKNYTGFIRFPEVSPSTKPKNEFYAALYIKFVDGKAMEAVVAIRGTLFNYVINNIEDIISWTSDVLGNGDNAAKPPVFLTFAREFIWASLDYLQHNFPHLIGITLTGHSLGAALAQLCVLSGAFVKRAITFNSPGIGHLVSEQFKQDSAARIYNINSRYGIINKIGEAVGKIYLIDVPELAIDAKALYHHFNANDFIQSVKLYNKKPAHGLLALSSGLVFDEMLKNDAVALKDRIMSYLDAEQGLINSPLGRRQYAYFKNLDDKNQWFHLEGVIKLKFNEQRSLAKDSVNIITAQHSINNMVSTLNSSTYAGFAHKAVTALAAEHNAMLIT